MNRQKDAKNAISLLYAREDVKRSSIANLSGLNYHSLVVLVSNPDNPKEKEEFKIVGVGEGAPLENKISIESPLGKALLNRTKGEIVEVDTPSGKIKYKILKII